jgi:hypothetical protein
VPHPTSEVPRWFVALGAVPVVTFAVAERVTDGDPVAAFSSAFGAQRVVAWLAATELRRRGASDRRAERLADRAADPRWLAAPFWAALVWVAVDLFGRVRADPGDWWSWGFLVLSAVLVVATAVDVTRRGVRRLRARARRRAAARTARRGVRVA